MTKHVEAPIVEAEFTEVEEGKPQGVKCSVTVGMTEAGDIFFNVDGSDQSLINIEGLLAYADRHMDKIWEGRLNNVQQAE
jgi:hypothetical protein